MIHQVIVSNQNPMTIQIPENYLGKELEVIVFEKEEGKKSSERQTQKDLSKFIGILSKEDADKLHKHVNQSRDEWERNI